MDIQNTIRVESLDEALKLAKEWKSSGRYNLFRGQARNWEIKSTFSRIDERDLDEHLDKLDRFLYFLDCNIELKKHLKKVDNVYAIAQHYGLVTNYIDFSRNPDVAAYFATNSKSNKVGEEACIICVNTERFALSMKSFQPFLIQYLEKNAPGPYFVDIHVENLWRLQAQEGMFLYSPFRDIEGIYLFDRILFPFESSFSGIIEEEIYPKRKSSLEIILDNYFSNEKNIRSNVRLIKEFGEENVVYLPEHLLSDYLIEDCAIHYSWKQGIIKSWKNSIDEIWQSPTQHPDFEIQFSVKDYNSLNYEAISKQIITSLNQDSSEREKLYRWRIKCFNIPVSFKLKKNIEKGCNIIWDGMRRLPYTNEHIAKAISRFIFMATYYEKHSIGNFDYFIHESVYIEMSYSDHSTSRAYVSGYGILNSCRKDIVKCFQEEYREIVKENPLATLQLANKPQYVFRFNEIINLFSEDIIPTQMVLKIRNNNLAIYFNPAYLEVFGIS